MNQKNIALFLFCGVLVACHDKHAATNENFSLALRAYLAERGELCLGKNEWPIDVTEREAELGTRDAKQMPVLERLGIVSSTDAVAQRKSEEEVYSVRVKRYELTAAGRTFYHPRNVKNAQGNVVRSSDLCAAELSLDQIKNSQVTTAANGQQSAVLWYTYRVAPAPWTADPEVQRVFPMVARVIHGAGKDELREEVTLGKDGWVAVDVLGGSSAPSPSASQASAR
jgi:hypothetical protein